MSNFLGKKFGEGDIIVLDDGFRNDGINPNPSNPYRPKEPLLQKMKEEKLKKAKMEELDKAKAKERAKEFSYFKKPKRLFDKLTANPIIIGIVLVAGYLAYKKFK